MPRVEATVHVAIEPAEAFAVSQTQGEIRYRWDTFVRSQKLLHGATTPDVGVQTQTRSKHGLKMVSEYVSFKPPGQVGMKMVGGPWFFKSFGGGWAFRPADGGGCDATWRYTFAIRPSWLSPIADRIGIWLLGRDINKRIAGFAQGCADPVVLEAARASITPEGSVTEPGR